MNHRLLVFTALTLLSAGCATNDTRRTAPAVVRNRKAPELYTLQTTGYCDCKGCCGWKRNWLFQPVVASGPGKGKAKKVGMTASGKWAHPGTIAADTALFPFGTVMFIPGYGYGQVEDRGGAIKGYKVDLFFGSHGEALQWGKQKKQVKVWK
jgi:3D (Asp-Asp-Asp) domain-containing protein